MPAYSRATALVTTAKFAAKVLKGPKRASAPALLTLFLLVGCGGGDDSIDLAKNKPNSFPPAKNALDDFSDNSTGDSSNSVGLNKNQVRVTVEVPVSAAPDGEETRRNLRIVPADRITVYRTDNSLQRLNSVNAFQISEENGRTVIEFEGDRPPIGPDVIIEAAYGNTVQRAFASDSDRDIKINPFSEYLVRKALGGYSSGQFEQVMACVNSDDNENLCLNKYVWSTLSDQVQDFEIDIPSGADLGGALQLLEARADFRRYVSNMAGYALLDSASSGKISAQSADYNSVFFGVELGQSFLVSSDYEPGQWGTRSAREEVLQDDRGIAYLYPGLTLTSFDVFNIRVTSLANDIPYARATVAQTRDNQFFERQSDYWELNNQSTSPGAATLKDRTRLLAGRSLFQSVTGRNSTRIIGWTRNPYYLDAYVGGNPDEPDRVLNGYFSAGKAIELASEGRALKRIRTLENHYLSALDINLARPDGEFDLAQLDGQAYNVVTFATRLGAANQPVRVETGVGSWTVAGQAVTQALGDTLSLQRDNTGAVSTGLLDRSDSLLVSHRTATLSTGRKNIGRLNLDTDSEAEPGARPDVGVGASNPDGTSLAFNLDNNSNGDGILLAAAQHENTPRSGSYRVQGLTMGMDTDTNRLAHFMDATLTLDGDTAILETSGVEVTHTVSQERVSSPAALNPQTLNLTYTDLSGGRVLLSDGNGLVLEGFASADQGEMMLRVNDTSGSEPALGILLATALP
ncbi:hypothetical protein [Marinobacter salicampi]|uniref:hypothetical protein n=1 Tax=Marinobacter salicampi TaxID=435907 RepID=UPI001F5FE669|nr:hypothetical protein [Marinobacter salicampi]